MLVGNAAEGTIGLMLSPTGIIVTPVELEPEPFFLASTSPLGLSTEAIFFLLY